MIDVTSTGAGRWPASDRGGWMSETLYKWLRPNGEPIHGCGRWELPNGSRPGAWRDVTGTLIACRNAIHACREQDLIHWMGPELYEFEARGDEWVDDGNKILVRSGRLVRRIETWNARTARLFAADCATYEMGLYGDDDDRSWNAIFTAQRYAFGLVGETERATARANARDTGGAYDAAGAAPWAAVGAAAWEAARNAAWIVAERDVLTARLMEYIRGEVDIDAIRESVS